MFTRAAPFLTLVFLGEMLGAIQLDWSLWANVVAALGGLVVLLAAFGVVNRLRGRPFWAFPEDVGRVELAAFVLLPAMLPLIFGGQLGSALATAGGNALLLLLVYAVVGYGLLSIVRWASGRLFAQLRSSSTCSPRRCPCFSSSRTSSFSRTSSGRWPARCPARSPCSWSACWAW